MWLIWAHKHYTEIKTGIINAYTAIMLQIKRKTPMKPHCS